MWQKIDIITKIIAAILIPTMLALMANQLSVDNKQKDVETKLIEISTNILSKEVANQSEDHKRLRKWAVDIINAYSKIKMDVETRNALINGISLPATALTTSADVTWAVVFGGDRTLALAQHEIRVTAKRAGVDNGEIFFRDGVYRSVAIFVSRNEAEQALQKLKTVRDSSYLVDMSKWCREITDQKDHRTCSTK